MIPVNKEVRYIVDFQKEMRAFAGSMVEFQLKDGTKLRLAGTETGDCINTLIFEIAE